MAVQRERPYENHSFRVDLGTGNDEGFASVELIDAALDVVEYREGGDKEANALKLPGRPHHSNVVLRRGITGDLSLYAWWNQIRNGDVHAFRTVVIELLSEDATSVVLTWRLLRAWPARLSYGRLAGDGNDVAMETLELAYERLEIE
jgi:phage tail-like protein